MNFNFITDSKLASNTRRKCEAQVCGVGHNVMFKVTYIVNPQYYNHHWGLAEVVLILRWS